MTLRTRLIAAFLALSVLPLGVVTFYTYKTSVDAMRNVAANEADLLSAVLTQRMQVITTQLSDRIEHLIEVTAPEPKPVVVRQASATPAPAASPAAPAMTDQELMNHKVADALGEAAVLLNTVNVQGMGGGRGSFPGARPGGGPNPNLANASGGTRPGGQGADANGTGGARGANGGFRRPDGTLAGPRPPGPTGSGTGASAAGGTGATTAAGSANGATDSSAGQPKIAPVAPVTPLVPQAPTSFATAPPTTPSSPAAPGRRGGNSPSTFTTRPPGSGTPAPGDPHIITTDDGMKIDLSQMRRDIYREILPSTPADQLTPEERQRIGREVNQRMLGIVEGIKLSAAELQKQAQVAREKPEADVKAVSKTAKAAAANAAAATPTAAAPAPAPVATPAPTTETASTTTAPTTPLKRTAEFSGNRLDIKFERDGKVVRTVNAEINLPNMLMTVFASTPRDQGELPFAVDKDGKVYAPSDEDKKRVEGFGAVATPTGPLGKVVLADWIVVTTEGPAGTGLRFGIARPTGDSIAALRQTAGRNVGFGLLFIAVALVGVVPVSGRLTHNLEKLTEGVARIARGDYSARVTVKSHDEIGALATAFNTMAADVEKHQRSIVEQERIKRELELGRQIQHDMLPHGALRLGLTEIMGVSVPAREVGGDFFNYFELPSGHIAMLVGDVSGKGVGPALLMANLQASLRTRLALGQNLSAVAEAIDMDIERNAPESLYATLFVGMLDPVSRIFSYVNCGHHPQFILRNSGGLDRMPSTGLPVGLLAGRGYRHVDVQLEAGDRLFFYTDGCVEAENEVGEFFGADRLEAAIAGGDNPDAVLAQVERAVEKFRGSRELLDDVTVMAVKVG